ncbi:hypothetical protein LK10_05050 [Sinomonas humi]|uniref:Uncharacterized protein n=1 Tax=Sinomonas humi TaxID=1338436 RepID=A0A0B2AQQ6_9MICC|nr:hypothetical protein LK10_05050 [Sinomonas humi]
MPVLLGERGVVVAEGALGDEEVRALGKLFGALALRGVHDEREALPAPGHAHVLEPHFAEPALALEAADVGPGDAHGGEALRHERTAVRLGETVAVGLDAVLERLDLEAGRDVSGRAVRHEAEVDAGRCDSDESPHHELPRGGVVNVDGMLDAIEGHARDHAWEPVAVVAVDMCEADACDIGARDAGVDHLALRPLAGIEQEALAVPPQEVTVVVAGPGRYLGGSAEDHEFAHAA